MACDDIRHRARKTHVRRELGPLVRTLSPSLSRMSPANENARKLHKKKKNPTGTPILCTEINYAHSDYVRFMC